MDSGNATIAKKEAGYSDNTAVTELRNNPKISHAIERKQGELWEQFKDYAEEALQVQVDIMRSDEASFKVKLDASNSILDRAGYRPIERREVNGQLNTCASATINLEMVHRIQRLMAQKGVVNVTPKPLEIESTLGCSDTDMH